MKKKIAILSATVLSLSLMTTSVFAGSPMDARAAKISKSGEKIISIMKDSAYAEISLEGAEIDSEIGFSISGFGTLPNENITISRFGDDGELQILNGEDIFKTRVTNGFYPSSHAILNGEMLEPSFNISFFGQGIDEFLESNTTLTDEEKARLKEAYASVEPYMEQLQAITHNMHEEKDEAKREEIKTQMEQISLQIREQLEPVSDIIKKMMPTISFSESGITSIAVAGTNLATISSEDIQRMLDNTSLTQEEKDKVMKVYEEIAPLGEKLSSIIKDMSNETDESKRAELVEQLKEIEQQVEAATEPIKDIIKSVMPTAVKRMSMDVSAMLDSATLQKLLDANTTMTEAEKNEIKAAYSEIEPLQAQLKALFESMSAEDANKEEISAQMKELSEKIREKQKAINDLIQKLLPERFGNMLEGGIVFNKGEMGIAASSDNLMRLMPGIGRMAMFNDTMIDAILENNTELTDSEKATIKDTYSDISDLNSQISDLGSQFASETDEAKRAELKSQIETISAKISDKMEAIQDLTAKLMPNISVKMSENGSVTINGGVQADVFKFDKGSMKFSETTEPFGIISSETVPVFDDSDDTI